ncbi:MAG: DUF4163 domain-containing protein [Porphyrobacter sp.]|nr:DUF4163 domain-containing protein [Porphyrobacter sp.]
MRIQPMFHAKHPEKRLARGASRGQRRSSGGLVLLAGLLLASCSSPRDMAANTAAAEAASPAKEDAQPDTAAQAVAFADNAEKDGGSREFSYKWPAEVSAIPALSASFTDQRDLVLRDQKEDWNTALADFAGEDCVGCKSLSFSKEWKVVADLPRYLSLSAEIYVYTGGAHGNSGFDALVWDRKAGEGHDPKALFVSEKALQDALGDPWCKALKAERRNKVGVEVTSAPDDPFAACPPISDLTLLLGSSDGRSFDRIGLIAAPYVAGSYAEGAYEVTLPVTRKVLEAVKPDYKAAFALGT